MSPLVRHRTLTSAIVRARVPYACSASSSTHQHGDFPETAQLLAAIRDYLQSELDKTAHAGDAMPVLVRNRTRAAA
jgi:hypothetical protein